VAAEVRAETLMRPSCRDTSHVWRLNGVNHAAAPIRPSSASAAGAGCGACFLAMCTTRADEIYQWRRHVMTAPAADCYEPVFPASLTALASLMF